MSFLLRPSIFLSVTIVAACFPSVIKHNQHLAARAAENFSQLAFVQRSFTDASTFVAGSGSTDEVRKMVERLHPSGRYPVNVVAVSYEPIPGTESMKIYLDGSGADSTYRYVAVMEGTELAGYKVSAVARSEGPFPESNNVKPLR